MLPDVPPWVVSRPRAAEQLDLGVSGLLTLVTAPTGWGKTQAVAEWAADAQLPGALLWLNVAGAAADPDVFWMLLGDAMVEAGEERSVPIPDVGSHERRRTHALTMLGAFLRQSGPWVVVLDDFPRGRLGSSAGISRWSWTARSAGCVWSSSAMVNRLSRSSDTMSPAS